MIAAELYEYGTRPAVVRRLYTMCNIKGFITPLRMYDTYTATTSYDLQGLEPYY